MPRIERSRRRPAFRPAAAAAALAQFALAGCLVGPSYRGPPPSALPARFAAAGAEPAQEPLEHWWTVFRDPTLDALIARALRNNRDLKLAASRVREARAERAVAAGELIPEVDATAGYNRGRGSKTVQLPLGGGGAPGGAASSSARPAGGAPVSGMPSQSAGPAGSGRARSQDTGDGSATAGGSALPASAGASQPPGGPATPFGEGGLPGVTTNLFQLGFDAVWEVDLFGGTRRGIQAADAQAAAAVEGERGVRVTLLAEVASAYLQLRAEQARETIARRSLAAQRETWRIAEAKFRAGLATETEAAQAEAQAASTEATLPPLLAGERAARHALAYLVGAAPDALEAELSPIRALPAQPPTIPLGVPSELLRRRPDIRQAERQLAAATAEQGVAVARLFPQFSVTGSFGFDSSALRQLPEWGSHYYSVAPGIDWPLLEWPQLRAAIRVENELQAQAVLNYQNTVAQALKEVEDALVQYAAESERNRTLVRAVAAAVQARQIAAQTFSSGLADQLALLEAEQSEFQLEDARAQSDAGLRTDLVALYKALGGGWRPD